MFFLKAPDQIQPKQQQKIQHISNSIQTFNQRYCFLCFVRVGGEEAGAGDGLGAVSRAVPALRQGGEPLEGEPAEEVPPHPV